VDNKFIKILFTHVTPQHRPSKLNFAFLIFFGKLTDNILHERKSLTQQNGNVLLFHMTQPIRNTIKVMACSKPTISEN